MFYENFLKFELDQIINVQKSFRNVEPLLVFASEYMSPSKLMQYFGPIIAALCGGSMLEMILIGTFADYVGQLLKWITSEHRPFWWVHETTVFSGLTRPHVQQHRLTCETTSGNPSGHAIGATVFFYIQAKSFYEFLLNHTDWNSKLIKFMLFTVFIFFTGFMWISRMYFGCHFLHQCILGSALAIFICNFFNQRNIKDKIYSADKRRAFFLAICCAGLVGIFYVGMLILNVDPHWSVRMAFKWCEDPELLRHETTALYSLTKNLGSIVGVAASPLRQKPKLQPNRLLSVPATILTMIANHVAGINTPKNHGRFVFLSYVFCVNCLFSFTMISIIPKICGQVKKVD